MQPACPCNFRLLLLVFTCHIKSARFRWGRWYLCSISGSICSFRNSPNFSNYKPTLSQHQSFATIHHWTPVRGNLGQGASLFDTKKQGASQKICKRAESRQMIILEQGAPKMIKTSMEQRKLLKRSTEHKKNPGARGKNKKGQGAQDNEKEAGEKV